MIGSVKKARPHGAPFPRRWLAYIVLKLFVIALVVAVALRWQGRL